MPTIVGAAITGSVGLPMDELARLSKDERDQKCVEKAAKNWDISVSRVIVFSSSQEGDRWVVNCGYGEETAP